MVLLFCGSALVVAAFFMLRVARPQPDGTPVWFLRRDSLATLYALLITALIGLGIALTASGFYAVFSTSTG
jgi:hypothetical protein